LNYFFLFPVGNRCKFRPTRTVPVREKFANRRPPLPTFFFQKMQFFKKASYFFHF